MIAEIDSKFFEQRPGRAIARIVSHLLFQGRPLTTRARWLNAFILRFLRFGTHLPQLHHIRQPIFIVGTGRSGTTVLGTVLSLHKEVGFLNEPKALWHTVYPYEDVIGSYSRSQAHYRLGVEQATTETARRARRLYGLYLWMTRSGRVLDKYPEMIFRIPFVRSLFPDAHFIFIVRNGWDTIRSIDRWSDRAGETVGSERHDWWGTDDRKWHRLIDDIADEHPSLTDHTGELHGIDRHVDRAALEWALTMEEGRSYLQEDDAFHLVRYEDLTTSPSDTLSELLEFVNLQLDEAVLRYGMNTLSPVPQKETVDLHPLISPLFNKMMKVYQC